MSKIYIAEKTTMRCILVLIIFQYTKCQPIQKVETICDLKKKMEQKVDGIWSDWDEWGSCLTKSHCDGTRTRTRKCLIPTLLSGSTDCPGNKTETEQCVQDTCQTCCESCWLRFQKHCYLFKKGEFNLTEAQALCEKEGAYMVEIISFTVEEFLKQKMEKDGIVATWTGGRKHQGQWKWAHSGQPFVYSNWSPIDPNGDGIAMMYTLYYSGGKWADIPSHSKKNVICQSDSNN